MPFPGNLLLFLNFLGHILLNSPAFYFSEKVLFFFPIWKLSLLVIEFWIIGFFFPPLTK